MIFCLGLFIFSAQLASLFNGGTELAKQIKIMSFSLIISSFGGQPRALLARELRFDVISRITILSAIFNFVFAVFLSYVYRSPGVLPFHCWFPHLLVAYCIYIQAKA
jgi:lipopolysaccharide exporter